MRPTAEGLEEENRKPKSEPKIESREPETPVEPNPVAAPEPLNETLSRVFDESPREWGPEPTSPPPEPVFAEAEPESFAYAEPLALPAEQSRYEEAEEPEHYEDEDESEDEVEASEAADREDKDEDKDSESEARGDGKKRRSRGRRGGRRRNGREATPKTAASAPESAEEDEEDEVWHEPAEEPAPSRVPARVTAMPAPAPSYRVARGNDSYVIPQGDFESVAREIVISVPESRRADHERKIAMFCDFENIALGVRDSDTGKFDINLVLERLLEKGKIIVKKAYADWERYSDYKRPFHEAAIELIDIPQKFYSGKNSADIKMVVDAMDLSYAKEHLDTFVILSGDSDFSPLVSKLKENNKYVIGVGVKNSSSNLLVDNCDEFIYYEDVWRDSQKGPKLDGLNKKTAEVFSLMIESIQALVRENKDVLWGSMIKQTMQRKKPSFNEGYYGYSTFSELLEDAARKNIVKLKKDQRSGTYIVTGFAKSGDGAAAVSRR
ncbi:MAG TPA: NYN domain-containing protein [Thermoanaerobaculia bacterium]